MALHAAFHRRPTTLLRPNKSEEDDDDRSEASSISILSRPEYDRDYYQPPKKSIPSFEERWEKLREKFDRRHELLEILSEKTSGSFMRQLRQREERVRLKSFQRLLDELENETERRQYIPDLLAYRRLDPPRTPRWNERFRDTCVFEWHTSIPAIYCLIVHSIAHNALFEGLNAFLDALKPRLASWTMSGGEPISDRWFFGVVFVVGLLCLRLTGDLYWWLPDYDYDIVRYDFQNRLRIGPSFVNVTGWIRKYSILRVAIFMVGHHLCYVSAGVFVDYLQRVTDQKASILEHLPSVRLEEQMGVCYAELADSFCSKACQDHMETQGTLSLDCWFRSCKYLTNLGMFRARVRASEASRHELYLERPQFG